jgi:hypothetical protein
MVHDSILMNHVIKLNQTLAIWEYSIVINQAKTPMSSNFDKHKKLSEFKYLCTCIIPCRLSNH